MPWVIGWTHLVGDKLLGSSDREMGQDIAVHDTQTELAI